MQRLTMCQVCKYCHINPIWIWRLAADELCEVIVVVVVVAVLHFTTSLLYFSYL